LKSQNVARNAKSGRSRNWPLSSAVTQQFMALLCFKVPGAFYRSPSKGAQ
jgi:hypothetical protein